MVVSRCRSVVVGTVAVALVAGVSVGGSAVGASTHGRKTATYTASKKGAVAGPGHLAPGRAKITVKGAKGQAIQLVRSRHGAGKAQLLADAAAANSDMPDPLPLEHDFVLVGGTQVGESLYVTLKKGTYFAADTAYEGKPTAADVKQITVRGKTKNATVPKTAGTITAIHSESWSKKPKSIKHKGVLLFANHASQPHFVVLTKMKKGKTAKDIAALFSGKETQGEVFYSAPKYSFDTGAINPHTSMRSTYSLPKGTYGLLCFYPDPRTHMPHAFMGMVRTIVLK